jgi:hypothetical protein
MGLVASDMDVFINTLSCKNRLRRHRVWLKKKLSRDQTVFVARGQRRH